MRGRVSKIVAEKGFGFIMGEDKAEYFFHRSDFNGFFQDLVVDTDGGRDVMVEFDPDQTDKGRRARNVRTGDQ